jgi:hypothetical protein
MNSLVSYFVSLQILPTTIYDLGQKHTTSWAPLEQIIIHKYSKTGLATEKKIEVLTPPRNSTQNECFRVV